MNKPVFSIIAIFHNEETTAKRCLDSYVIQSYPHRELICVDDCSTDNTLSILKGYEAAYPDIRVIELDVNSSENVARKRGIEAASGEYIMFVDGDDALEADACVSLAGEIERDPVDILHFGTRVINCGNVSDEELRDCEEALQPCISVFQGNEVFSGCFVSESFQHNMCNKLFNSRLLKTAFEHIEAISLHYAADRYQFFVVSWYASSYRGISDRFYDYYLGNGISSPSNIGLAQYEKLCSGAESVEAIRRFALSSGDDQLISAAENIRIRMVDEAIWRADTFLDAPMAEGIRILCGYYDISVVVSRLACRYYDDWSFLSDLGEDSHLFELRAGAIRTIAIFVYRLYNGGTKRVAANLASLWTDMGYRVILFTDESEYYRDYSIPDSVVRVVLPSTFQTDRENYYERAKVLSRALTEYEVDLLVYNSCISPLLMWDLLICRLSHIRFVVYCHSVFAHSLAINPSIFMNMPYAYALADGIVTLSETDREYWSQFNDTIFLTVNPLRYGSVSEIPRSEQSGNTLIWCQRLSEEKNRLI